jgi:hypothetical protein
MKSAPHPPYSPDLAPLDFYLFGDVKKCLAGLSFEDTDQFLAAVEGVLEGIEKVALQAVFLEWMDRLRKCIATNGEYTEPAQINVIGERNFILPILRCSCPGGTPCRKAGHTALVGRGCRNQERGGARTRDKPQQIRNLGQLADCCTVTRAKTPRESQPLLMVISPKKPQK